MKKAVVVLAISAFVLFSGSSAFAGFYAISDEVGYQGTIWNITKSTGSWNTSTPRDAVLNTVVNAPLVGSNINMIGSNWSEHTASDVNNSFFQLAEDNNVSVTSADASWSPDFKVFTMAVTGANAPYSTSFSRFWQPDTVNGVAWGVTYTNYAYSFVATFSSPAILDGGFYINSAPDTITGQFSGQFVVTEDENMNTITNGDTYGFQINFSNVLLDPLDNLPPDWSQASYFGVSSVPEPLSIILLGSAIFGMVGVRRYFSH
jgi:hypothetical protein